MTIAVPALLFIVTGVVAIAVLGRDNGEPLGSALAVGILSSLFAAMIANLVRVVGAVRVQQSPAASHPAGLIGMKAKCALKPDDWLNLLHTARTEFYIAGHSLGKWCSESNRQEFMSHVRRIVDGRGRVTLVMIDPGSPQIARLQLATSVDYSGRVQTSLHVLAELRAGLDSASRAQLTISVLTDPVSLPYMVVGNDRRLVTSTYLGSTDNEQVLCLELDRSSDAAAAVYDDFHQLARLGTAPALPGATTDRDIADTAARPVRRRWRTR